MKIYYIYHSGFVIETQNSYLIFDFFKSKPFKKIFDFDFENLLEHILLSHKAIYVFVSHSHSDHYNPNIFTWQKRNHNICYILSDDIVDKPNISNTYIVSPNTNIKINDINVQTFGSTDVGVSFLVTVDNKNIFHAGDLNWWKWIDDTPEEAVEMETSYKNIIYHIVLANKRIDAAFFPLDSRLGEQYSCGSNYFIDMLSPNIFIPMHLWAKFQITDCFAKATHDRLGENCPNILSLHHHSEILL